MLWKGTLLPKGTLWQACPSKVQLFSACVANDIGKAEFMFDSSDTKSMAEIQSED